MKKTRIVVPFSLELRKMRTRLAVLFPILVLEKFPTSFTVALFSQAARVSAKGGEKQHIGRGYHFPGFAWQSGYRGGFGYGPNSPLLPWGSGSCSWGQRRWGRKGLGIPSCRCERAGIFDVRAAETVQNSVAFAPPPAVCPWVYRRVICESL